jgi:heme/copper-type cytochrome/quinol oxidase subunit 4
MNITREVVTDLLPVYLSGEASEDTGRLVEEYFRQDPDFERIARSAARPLDALRTAAPVAPDAEREKRDLECIRHELRWRKMLFALAVFLTLAPLTFVYSNGHLVWLMVRNAPWDAGFYWSWGALLWFFYFSRVRRRTLALVAAIFFTLIPPLFALHFSFAGWPQLRDNLGGVVIAWIGAAFCWLGYFRQRSR